MGAHYYAWPLWVMVVLPFAAAALWGIFGRLIYKYRPIWLGINIALVVVGLLLIYWETLGGRTVGLYAERYGTPELMPFSSFTRDEVDDETFRSMFCNVMLFVPLGAGLANVLRSWRCSWALRRVMVVTVVIGIAVSVVIETIQYAFSMGLCETDDVIMNGIGALIGAGSILLVQNTRHEK